MLTFSADELRAIATKIFRAAGTEEEPTRILVDHLVDANLAGHDSHGVLRIPYYVNAIAKGRVKPNSRPEIIRETPVSALIDGKSTFGQVSARFGTEVAIRKAQDIGVAVAGVVHCTHIGRLGTYASLASSQGVFAMVTIGNLAASTAPYGGRQGAFSTNPYSFGFPAAERPDLMVDFATSAIAGGKVMLARAKHTPVPAGSLIDKEGNPTTNPEAYFDGGMLLPFGGHKGSALATLSVLLSHVLVPTVDFPGGDVLNGTFILAVDSGIFQDRAKVATQTDDVLRKIKATPPASGFEEVLFAGEPEVRAAAQRRLEGIPVAEDTWTDIVEAARSVGVTLTH